MDLVLSFNLIFIDTTTGEKVKDRRRIARNYLKFWFWIDLLSCLPLDLFILLFVGNRNGNLKGTQLVRIIRLARLLKLIRHLKLGKVNVFIEKMSWNPLILKLLKLLGNILLVAHLLACFWYYITTPDVTGDKNSRTWVKEFGYEHLPIFDQYVGSLYWVMITIITVGYGDVHATNSREQLFSIFTMLCGSVMMGAVISQVTRIMALSNPQAKAFKDKMDELKAYLNGSFASLPQELKFRTIDAYAYYLRKRSAFGEAAIFNELPQNLLSKLIRNVYSSEIQSINLFRKAGNGFVLDMMAFARPFHAFRGEIICMQGDIAADTFFLLRGLVRIIVHDGTHDVVIGYVTQGHYFGDMEICMKSSYQATYEAVIPSSLLAISSEAVSNATRRTVLAGQSFLEESKVRYQNFSYVMKRDLIEAVKATKSEAGSIKPTSNASDIGDMRTKKHALSSINIFNPFSPTSAAIRDIQMHPAGVIERRGKSTSKADQAINQPHRIFSPYSRPSIVAPPPDEMSSLRSIEEKNQNGSETARQEPPVEKSIPNKSPFRFSWIVSPTNKNDVKDSTISPKLSSPSRILPRYGSEYAHDESYQTLADISDEQSKNNAIEQQLQDIISPQRNRNIYRRSDSKRFLSPKAIQARKDLILDVDAPAFYAKGSMVSPESLSSNKSNHIRHTSIKIEEAIAARGLLTLDDESLAKSFQSYVSTPAATPVSRIQTMQSIYDNLSQMKSDSTRNAADSDLDNNRGIERTILWVDGAVQDLNSFTTEISKFFENFAAPYRVIIQRTDDKNKKYEDIIESTTSEIFYTYRVIHPNLQLKMYWDVLLGLFILYSAITVPIEIAFLGSSNPLNMVDYTIDGIFFSDLCLSSRLSYFDGNRDAWMVIPSKIYRQYLTTWFTVDLLSCLPFDDIVSAAVDYSTKNLNLIRLLKILRLFRLAKLARMLHLTEVMDKFEHYSGISPLTFELFKIVLQILIISHFVACIWWGTSTYLTERSWYDDIEMVYSNLRDAAVSQKYLVSMYWSVTTLSTVGYGDIAAINTEERIIAIIVMLIGATLFGYIVGNVASLMGNFTLDEKSERVRQVKDYLTEKQCSMAVTNGIIHHLNRKYERESTLNEELILSRLPMHISNQLLSFHYHAIMERISLFQYIYNESVKIHIFKLMTVEFYDKGQYLLREDRLNNQILFILEGKVDVIQIKRKPHRMDQDVLKLDKKKKEKKNLSEVVTKAFRMRRLKETGRQSIHENLSIENGSSGQPHDSVGLDLEAKSNIVTVSERIGSLLQPFSSPERSTRKSISIFNKSNGNTNSNSSSPPNPSSPNQSPKGESNRGTRRGSTQSVLFNEIIDNDKDDLSSASLNQSSNSHPMTVVPNPPSMAGQDRQDDPIASGKVNPNPTMDSELPSLVDPFDYSPTVILAACKFKELGQRRKQMKENGDKARPNSFNSSAISLATDTNRSVIETSNNNGSFEGNIPSNHKKSELKEKYGFHETMYNVLESKIEDDKYEIPSDDDEEIRHAIDQQNIENTPKKNSHEPKEYRIIGQVEAGEFIGLISMMRQKKSSLLVRAASSCRIYSLRKSVIKQLIQDYPAVAFHLQVALGKILKDQQYELAKRHIRQSRAHFLKSCKKDFIRLKEQGMKGNGLHGSTRASRPSSIDLGSSMKDFVRRNSASFDFTDEGWPFGRRGSHTSSIDGDMKLYHDDNGRDIGPYHRLSTDYDDARIILEDRYSSATFISNMISEKRTNENIQPPVLPRPKISRSMFTKSSANIRQWLSPKGKTNRPTSNMNQRNDYYEMELSPQTAELSNIRHRNGLNLASEMDHIPQVGLARGITDSTALTTSTTSHRRRRSSISLSVPLASLAAAITGIDSILNSKSYEYDSDSESYSNPINRKPSPQEAEQIANQRQSRGVSSIMRRLFPFRQLSKPKSSKVETNQANDEFDHDITSIDDDPILYAKFMKRFHRHHWDGKVLLNPNPLIEGETTRRRAMEDPYEVTTLQRRQSFPSYDTEQWRIAKRKGFLV